MSIAWSNLSDLEIVQLLTMRPDLREDYDKYMGYTDTDRDYSPEAMSGVMGMAVSED